MKAINPNLAILYRAWKEGLKGVVLLGSSRSGKTISIIFFLIWVCSKNLVKRSVDKSLKPLDILIVRETYNSHKTTLYKDFNMVLPMFKLSSPFENVQDRSTFKLFGCRITLMGADNMSDKMGAGSDIVWLNEAIHISQAVFKQLKMRSGGFFILDSNPEESEHWIYDSVVTRSDILYLRTTFRDNPHCPAAQKYEILGYEPWLPGSYEVTDSGVTYNGQPISDQNQPPPHPTNHTEGTASELDWMIFGLGLKAEKKGRIYPRIYQYDDLPPDASFLGYGGDGGYNPDPTVILGAWVLGNNLYVKGVLYGTGLAPDEVGALMRDGGIKDYSYPDPDDVIMDAAEPMLIAHLRKVERFRMWKGKGTSSKQGNIRMLSQYKIHIHHESKLILRDFENFCWKWNELTDKPTGEPENTYKHSNDALAYLVYKAIGRDL